MYFNITLTNSKHYVMKTTIILILTLATSVLSFCQSVSWPDLSASYDAKQLITKLNKDHKALCQANSIKASRATTSMKTALDSMEYRHDGSGVSELISTTYYYFNQDYTIDHTERFNWFTKSFDSKEVWDHHSMDGDIVKYQLIGDWVNQSADTVSITRYYRNSHQMDTLIVTYYRNGLNYQLFEMEETGYNQQGEINVSRLRRFNSNGNVEFLTEQLVTDSSETFRMKQEINSELRSIRATHVRYDALGNTVYGYDSVINHITDSFELANYWINDYTNGLLDTEIRYGFYENSLFWIDTIKYLEYDGIEWVKTHHISMRSDSNGGFNVINRILKIRKLDPLKREVDLFELRNNGPNIPADSLKHFKTTYEFSNWIEVATRVEYQFYFGWDPRFKVVHKRGGIHYYEVIENYKMNRTDQVYEAISIDSSLAYNNQLYLIKQHWPNSDYFFESIYDVSESQDELVVYPGYYAEHPYKLESSEGLKNGVRAQYAYYWSMQDFNNVASIHKQVINIFPNPTSDFITVQLANNPTELRIFDITGRLMKSTVNQGRFQMDVSDLENGVYVCIVSSKSGNQSVKFIKE